MTNSQCMILMNLKRICRTHICKKPHTFVHFTYFKHGQGLLFKLFTYSQMCSLKKLSDYYSLYRFRPKSVDRFWHSLFLDTNFYLYFLASCILRLYSNRHHLRQLSHLFLANCHRFEISLSLRCFWFIILKPICVIWMQSCFLFW